MGKGGPRSPPLPPKGPKNDRRQWTSLSAFIWELSYVPGGPLIADSDACSGQPDDPGPAPASSAAGQEGLLTACSHEAPPAGGLRRLGGSTTSADSWRTTVSRASDSEGGNDWGGRCMSVWTTIVVVKMEVPIPLDPDGFLRRECQACHRQFKWLPSEGSEQPPDAATGAHTARRPDPERRMLADMQSLHAEDCLVRGLE
jgi:hypothetical protein